MNFIIYLVRDIALCVLCLWVGLVIGQWANLPRSEWDKVDAMTWKSALAKMIRWSYWSVRRFFQKAFRLYPFND